MSRFKLNLLSNFAGAGWLAVMQLAFVPLYVHFMGVEAYGLVGFYITLQGMLRILDFGLSPTMNREMARYSVQPEKADEARDFVRTLEMSYWVIGLAVGAIILATAPLIATHWINAKSIPTSVVEQAVTSMGVLVVLQWPFSFYQGGLLGLQRQVLLNGLKIVTSTLSSGGAVLVLGLVSPTIMAFFLWQIAAAAIQVVLAMVFLWRSLPPSDRSPRFDPGLIWSIWRFAAGMSGVTFCGLVLSQLDKLILSKLLSLELFGYYMLASIIGNSLAIVSGPVFNATFPHFSALVAAGDEPALKQLYHRGSQLVATLTLPLAMMVTFFSFDILLLWTGNAETARNVAPIASVLVIGSALNGLMNLPYALQLAYGWTSIGLLINTFFIVTFVPAIIFLVRHYGAVGAATAWVALNSMYVLIGVPLTHRRLLTGEARRWFAEDIGLPLTGAVLAVWVGRELIAHPLPPLLNLVSLSAVLLCALLVTALAASQMRGWMLSQLSRL
jgi:O-antigen/teichoic acid export membrane protein